MAPCSWFCWVNLIAIVFVQNGYAAWNPPLGLRDQRSSQLNSSCFLLSEPAVLELYFRHIEWPMFHIRSGTGFRPGLFRNLGAKKVYAIRKSKNCLRPPDWNELEKDSAGGQSGDGFPRQCTFGKKRSASLQKWLEFVPLWSHGFPQTEGIDWQWNPGLL